MGKHKVRPEDLRKMSKEERQKLLKEFRVEMITLRHKASVGALEDPGRLRELRRNIARILTIENEEARQPKKG
ncbi:MAG: 50S ribosomal protein L29 [Desulfurococcales archaeon]|nr:50S ribosomal protein L29 [Desulfurococcales archaeon]